MNSPQARQPRHMRYRARLQARLDTATHAKVEVLAAAFHRKRSAILRCLMPWGGHHSTGWTLDRSPVAAVPPVPVLPEPDLLQHVQEAAADHGATVAAWVWHAIRQVALENFPASWRAAETPGRSHDSRYYSQRFMLRLDGDTSRKLQHLVEQFAKPRAEIIRQLIAQETAEDFPPSWHLAVAERQRRAVQPVGRARSWGS